MSLKSMKWLVLLLCLVAGRMLQGETADPDTKTQFQVGDSIEATIVGRLTTAWDARTLFYAGVQAGGTEIELDPAGCEKVTAELLDFINTQGGGIITDIQVEANGFLVFEKRPKMVNYRRSSKEDPAAIVPVLKVRWIKITTLPKGKDVGSVKRDRARVESTVIGKQK